MGVRDNERKGFQENMAHGDFEPDKKYDGDIIRIDRLAEFIPDNYWMWDETGKINIDDISGAIHKGVAEIPEPYGDTWKHPVSRQRSRKWHIGRIIYFINHPEEIRDIEIDNACDSYGSILPQPIIVDGWHRYAAARWLYKKQRLTKIHCLYGGRMDILEYLQGKTDNYDYEPV